MVMHPDSERDDMSGRGWMGEMPGILALDGHRVTCIDRVAFCDRLRDQYHRMADALGEEGGHSDP